MGFLNQILNKLVIVAVREVEALSSRNGYSIFKTYLFQSDIYNDHIMELASINDLNQKLAS